jgi:uncharacterized membrane protein (DUF4010 family)
MDVHELISRFGVALGIGLLIGLERGWRRREAEAGSRAAGIRTFAITGLLGGILGAIAVSLGGTGNAAGGIVLSLGFAAYAAVITAFSRDENRASGSHSATTAIAGMVTFALGAYALLGDIRIAAAGAVAAAALLAFREPLHGWVETITWPELRSGLALLTMTFIALPIVPNESIGPFGGVNPRNVWLIAIILASVSFIGYAAVKYFGARRGLLFAAAAGGLVSSTAVTFANARRAAAEEGAPFALAAGVAVATAISFLRVLAIAAALKPSLLWLIAPSLLVAAVFAAGYAVILLFWHAAGSRAEHTAQFRNPFEFWSVIGFAIFLAAIIVLGRAAGEAFGATGVVLGAVVVGLADVDSVTVSIANLTPQPLGIQHAAFGLLAAVASNTVSKAAIGAGLGRGRFAAEITLMAAGCIIFGGAALWGALAFFAA